MPIYSTTRIIATTIKIFFQDFCLAHLFTDIKFEGGILGLAYVGSPRRNSVGGICTPEYFKNGYTLYLNSGLSSSRNHYGQRYAFVVCNLLRIPSPFFFLFEGHIVKGFISQWSGPNIKLVSHSRFILGLLPAKLIWWLPMSLAITGAASMIQTQQSVLRRQAR